MKSLPALKRKPLSVSADSLVIEEALTPGSSLPLVLKPVARGVNAVEWASAERNRLRSLLLRHGALLFRNFELRDMSELERLFRALSGELVGYMERSSPRSLIKDNIYTSTDYPPDQSIFFHNENSYQQSWPMTIFFYCDTPAERGGKTPIADCRGVYERLDPVTRREFAEKGWMLVRNFGGGFGLPWQEVFQTSDKSAVEDYCSANSIEFEWRPGDRLRTRTIRPAIATHPVTGETVWFNHAAFFHASTVGADIERSLLSEFGEEGLPAHTYFGDGSRIEPEIAAELRKCYDDEAVVFTWQKGDVLMVDNMLVAHSRAPYSGSRRILVAMAEPFNRHNQPSA